MGLTESKRGYFSSGFQILGTSPEFKILFISSRKDSNTIYESVNKKHKGLRLTPHYLNTAFKNSANYSKPNALVISKL